MGVPRDVSPFGSQTVNGPGWPNVDEEQLEHAAAQYEAWAAKLTGSVIPEQQGRVMTMQTEWTGPSSVAAAGEATSIIGSHQANAAQASTIALRLHAMAATVMETKAAVNAAAEEVQQECMAMQAMPVQNKEQLIQSRIKMGLAQNVATVNANAAGVTANAGVPPNASSMSTPPGGDQGMQMMMQMAQMAAQLPSQLAGMVTQAPQQLMQPLQSLTSMFGGGAGAGKGAGAGISPFSAFSNHPLAGGAGAGGGAGLVKAASVPGASGSAAQTPMMAKLVGASTEVSPMGAGSGAFGGVAPVNAGGGMGGGGPMMGQRGSGGASSTASLTAPAPLDYGSDDEVDDEW